MNKIISILLLIIFFPYTTHAQTAKNGTLEEALNLAPEPKSWIVPLKFREVIRKTFGDEQYDKMQNSQLSTFVAKNTKKLGGIPAHKFLKFQYNCRQHQIVTWIDEKWFFKCGTSSKLLVKIHSGKGMVNGILMTEGSFFLNGKTFVETDTTSQMELIFPDDSLIRLDQETKIQLDPIKSKDANTTLAQATFQKWVLWGRVFGKDGPQFRKGEYIAWVRWTSIMIDNSGIHALQSQSTNNAVYLTCGNIQDRTASGNTITSNCTAGWLPGCSSILSTWEKVTHQSKEQDYCLKDSEKITDFTKKDIAYLNTLLSDPACKTGACDDIKKEREITGPDTIGVQKQFCENDKLFFPDAINIEFLCLDRNVFAIATVTPNEAKIVWKKENEEWETIQGEMRDNNKKRIIDKELFFGAEFPNISNKKNSELYNKLKELSVDNIKYQQNQQNMWDIITLSKNQCFSISQNQSMTLEDSCYDTQHLLLWISQTWDASLLWSINILFVNQ